MSKSKHTAAEDEAVEMLLKGVSQEGGSANRATLEKLVRSAFYGGAAAEEISRTAATTRADAERYEWQARTALTNLRASQHPNQTPPIRESWCYHEWMPIARQIAAAVREAVAAGK